MSAIVCNSEIVHYEVLGRGRPVIFLHSWVGSWRYWVPTMQAISYNYRAYALDFWGYGDTAKIADFYDLAQQTELVEQFIHQMGIIGKVVLIGHGLGGLVALRYAREHEEVVARLVVSNCPLNGTAHPRLSADGSETLGEWLHGPSKVDAVYYTEAGKADPAAIRRASAAETLNDARSALASLPMQTLVVDSADDPLMTNPNSLDLSEFPPSLQWLMLEDCGHYPMLDESNLYSRLLLEFLELNAEDSPRQLQIKSQWKRRVR
ncbi:MAG: alpha/beta hydrolase [Anaerolineaceae bacterium]|nr:alpha/beta hydrolase [Anaerolineaceae bacterium]